MPTFEKCPSSAELSSFQCGQAETDRIEEIGVHLETCRACQTRLSRLNDKDLLAQGVRQSASEPDFATEPGYRRVVALAEHWREAQTQEATLERPHLQPEEAGSPGLGRLGPYRVLRELGEGAMGVVFEAEDTRLNRRVALKVLKPHWARTETAKKRFFLEARASANLVGDAIVPIYDIGEVAGGLYLAMALLNGETLETRLVKEPRLPAAVLLQFAKQMTRGLVLAHGQGIIHRDLKPTNLWIEEAASPSETENIKILDFGLARCIRDDARITQTGIVVGTPAYMAPEQANGGEVDARSDLFSLGCILYRMATGVVPFQGKDTLAVFWALASKEAVPPSKLNPELPEEISDLIMKLLAKDRAERPESAAAFLELLDQLQRPKPPRRLPLKKMAIACTICATLLLLTSFWWWPTPVDADPVVPAPEVKTVQPAPESNKVRAAKGLQFDGKGMVEITDFPLPVNGPYTLEAYVIPSGPLNANRQVVIGHGSNCRVTALEISSFRRTFPTWRFSWAFPHAIGEAQVKSDQRFHLAAVFTGTVATLFVGGKTDVPAVQANTTHPELPVVLKLGEKFVGTIEQVRISKTARYASDFTPQERLTADEETLGLYAFDEGAENTLHDRSGNSRHGKILGATWKLP